MDVKECYRVLELEVGATREAVEAAYCRLLERWHPNRVKPAGDPEGIRQANLLIERINEAFQTLTKIAPAAGAKSPAPAAGAKPTLPPLPAGQPASGRPPPPPPPTKSLPSPPAPTTPPPAASALPPAPTPSPVASAPKPPAAQATSSSDLRSKAVAFYETLFPPGSPRRRFGPVILAAALVFVLLLGKCAFSSLVSKSPEEQKAAAAAHLAQTTGRLVVKSNRANTTIEATRIPPAGEAGSSSVKGAEEGAAEQTLAGLPPGKYALTAHSDGWPEIRQEVSVDASRTTEVTINFKSGSLRLDSVPTGATVKLGATVLGKTPLLIPQLPPGECRLSVEYPSWPATIFKTTITENVETTDSVRLPHGKLTVESTPPGATVLQGKRTLGQTPLTLERVSVGTMKLTLQAKDFPPLEVSVTVEDRGEVKVSPQLGAGFPLLDPPALLRAVWVQDNPDQIAPRVDSVTGPYQPQNGIVRNLHRKRLFDAWLRKSYRFSAIVKSYDQVSGQVEFAEQNGDLSKYRVLAKLSPEARNDQNVVAQLAAKGATFTLYGRLSAVEEPRWPSKVITFEISSVEPLH